MTAKEQGLPVVFYHHDHGELVTLKDALAALASDTGERGGDAGFIEAAKCARRALARACTASPEYTRAYEQLDAAITAAALRAQPAGGELSVAQGRGWRLMGRMTIGGVVWEGPNPHDSDANAPGTRYYAAPAQPDGVES